MYLDVISEDYIEQGRWPSPDVHAKPVEVVEGCYSSMNLRL